jgi:DNA-binding NtrC family response regulator
MMGPARVLIVDDDKAILELMGTIANRIDHLEAVTENLPQKALARLKTESFGMLITDLFMPEMDGVTLLKLAKGLHPDLLVGVVTGFGDLEMAMNAIEAGAYGYVTKPFRAKELGLLLTNMMERQAVYQELNKTRVTVAQLQRQLQETKTAEEQLTRDIKELRTKLEAFGVSAPHRTESLEEAIDRSAKQKANALIAQNLPNELGRLQHLLDQNMITREEFVAFRKVILERVYGHGVAFPSQSS